WLRRAENLAFASRSVTAGTRRMESRRCGRRAPRCYQTALRLRIYRAMARSSFPCASSARTRRRDTFTFATRKVVRDNPRRRGGSWPENLHRLSRWAHDVVVRRSASVLAYLQSEAWSSFPNG